ncbi:MAG: helix-turn-helix domain-containing protein [Thermofilaceae archaeon]
MNAEKTLDVLRRLGLSDYEARAYVALLTMGQLTPAEVSSAANIPYTKTYEVMRRLERKGWVVVVSKSPLIYAPVKPEEVLAKLKRDFDAVLQEALGALKSLEREGAGTALMGLYVLRSFEALRRVARSIASESEEILALISDPRLVEELNPILPGKVVKGVLEEGVPKPGVGEWRKARVLLPLDLLIVDREKVLFHFGLLSLHGSLSGVLVSDREIAEAAARYFERIWEMSETLDLPG